jgi:N-acetylneuraminic acid mutarotase
VAVNGIIYAIGGAKTINPGAGATLVPLSTVETYVAATNGPWTTLAASLPSARYWNAVASVGNTIYSFGGVSERVYFQVVDSFGISSGQWDSAGQLPSYRYNAAAFAVGDTVYLIGGLVYAAASQGFTVTNEIDAWDPSTGTLSMRSSMMVERSDHQAVALGGKIYIIGGLGGSSTQGDCTPQTSVEVYDPSTNLVVPGPSLTTARMSFGAAAVNGKIYAIGGLDAGDTAVSSVEELDPVQNLWTPCQKLPKPRYGCAAVSSGNRIYVIGGVEGGTETGSVLVFYP